MKPKKVLFVVDNLVIGGVTKVLANLLKVLSKGNLEIDLMVLHRHSDMNIDLPENVNIISGGKRMVPVDYSIKSLIKQRDIPKIILKALFAFKIKTGIIKYTIMKDRKENVKKDYDVEIAFGDGFPYIYSFYGNSHKKIAWMHSDVLIKDHSSRFFKIIKNVLSGYDECVAVSDKVAESYMKRYSVSRVSVIHNLIDDEEIKRKSFDEKEKAPYENEVLNFVSVGRLDHSKNYPMLLEVAKGLIEKGYNFRMYIIGDGDERELLESLIAENSMEQRFILLGKKDNPYPYVKNADCFLLSSRYEGLPTVIIEALVLGVPCVSTNVAGIEQLLGKEYGIITDNNKDSFYKGIKCIFDNRELLRKFKENLVNYKYDNETEMRKIWDLLN